MNPENVLNSGRLLVNDNSFYCGSSSNLPCQLALKNDIPEVTPYVHPSEKQCNYAYTHPSTIQCSAATEINSLKSSVSSGKTQVANAIAGKGVSASGNDTFATLASKINQIQSTKQVVFTTTADSSGKWYMPAFGFVPRAFYAFQLRAWNESNVVAFQSIDFVLGMSWKLERVYLYPEDASGQNSNGEGIGGRFTPSKYSSVPNSSTNGASRLNPNNYVNGQLYPFYAPYMYNYENSQYLIYVIPA